MGTQQIILVIGASVLIGVLIFTINNYFLRNSSFEIYNEACLTGAALGQSMIDRILTEQFDEKSIGKNFTTPDSLTAVGSLGPEAGETTVSSYDDVDDYKSYIKYDTMAVFGVFKTRVDVNYAQKFNPDVISNVRTFTKRIDVFVTNAYIGDTLKFSYAVTY
jgi:hypothetical protein